MDSLVYTGSQKLYSNFKSARLIRKIGVETWKELSPEQQMETDITDAVWMQGNEMGNLLSPVRLTSTTDLSAQKISQPHSPRAFGPHCSAAPNVLTGSIPDFLRQSILLVYYVKGAKFCWKPVHVSAWQNNCQSDPLHNMAHTPSFWNELFFFFFTSFWASC